MTRKIRLTILLVCIVCFFVIAPILIFYSMGYRFDFDKMKITATGGIYVKTNPAADEIIFDSKTKEKPSMFSNSVFVQSLLPKDHTVLIEKNDYYNYSKTIAVQEKQVTKLENILLIKKDIKFEIVTDESKSPFNSQERFTIKNGSLYYSSIPENAGLSATQKSTPVLKKVVAFFQENNNILWLKSDGLLYRSDITNLSSEPIKLTLTPIKISSKGVYKIIAGPNGYPKNIFLNNNTSLMFFDSAKNDLINFYSPIKNAVISPDGKNIIYYDDKNIYISPTAMPTASKDILYKSSEKISDCQWLNNYYIIFTASLPGQENKITISETDYRGNINSVTLPQKITILEKTIEIKNPQIFFNQQDNKLYILTNNTLLSSEKLIP